MGKATLTKPVSTEDYGESKPCPCPLCSQYSKRESRIIWLAVRRMRSNKCLQLVLRRAILNCSKKTYRIFLERKNKWTVLCFKWNIRYNGGVFPITEMLCVTCYTWIKKGKKRFHVWNTKTFRFALMQGNFITKYRMTSLDSLPPIIITSERTHEKNILVNTIL